MLAVEDEDIPLVFSDFKEMVHLDALGLTCKLQNHPMNALP